MSKTIDVNSKELLLDAIIGKGFLSIADAQNFVERKLAVFSGNQHNESWEWQKVKLAVLSLDELLVIYMRATEKSESFAVSCETNDNLNDDEVLTNVMETIKSDLSTAIISAYSIKTVSLK